MAATCEACEAELRPEDRFCARCGTTVGGSPAFCARCGSPLDDDDRFCRRCGLSARRQVSQGDLRASTVGAASEEADDEWLEGLDFDDVLDVDSDAEAGTAAAPPAHQLPRITPARDAAATHVLPPGPAEVRAEASRTAAQPPQGTPRRGFPLGATLALLGGLAVAASALLDWTSAGDAARDIPAQFLLDPAHRLGGPTLAILLLAVGMAGALVALITMAVPVLRFLRRLVGLASLAAPILFAVQLSRAGSSVPEDLGIGVYVAGAGALLEVVAGRWFRR